MQILLSIDWARLFIPKESILEIVLRGTFVYLFLFAVLRLFLRRTTGALGTADLLVLIVIADAAANALGASYESLTEGGLLVLTLIFWNYVLDWVAHRFPAFERLIHEAPVDLVEGGRLNHRNMARQKVTEGELMKLLRQHGVEDPAEVRRAVLEDDGRLSVILRQENPQEKPPEDERQRLA